MRGRCLEEISDKRMAFGGRRVPRPLGVRKEFLKHASDQQCHHYKAGARERLRFVEIDVEHGLSVDLQHDASGVHMAALEHDLNIARQRRPRGRHSISNIETYAVWEKFCKISVHRVRSEEAHEPFRTRDCPGRLLSRHYD